MLSMHMLVCLRAVCRFACAYYGNNVRACNYVSAVRVCVLVCMRAVCRIACVHLGSDLPVAHNVPKCPYL